MRSLAVCRLDISSIDSFLPRFKWNPEFPFKWNPHYFHNSPTRAQEASANPGAPSQKPRTWATWVRKRSPETARQVPTAVRRSQFVNGSVRAPLARACSAGRARPLRGGGLQPRKPRASAARARSKRARRRRAGRTSKLRQPDSVHEVESTRRLLLLLLLARSADLSL